MRIEVHDNEELRASISRRPLVGAQEVCNVVVLLQQRQTVDGSFIGVVLSVG